MCRRAFRPGELRQLRSCLPDRPKVLRRCLRINLPAGPDAMRQRMRRHVPRSRQLRGLRHELRYPAWRPLPSLLPRPRWPRPLHECQQQQQQLRGVRERLPPRQVLRWQLLRLRRERPPMPWRAMPKRELRLPDRPDLLPRQRHMPGPQQRPQQLRVMRERLPARPALRSWRVCSTSAQLLRMVWYCVWPLCRAVYVGPIDW